MTHRREVRAKSFRFLRGTVRHCPYCGSGVDTASTLAKLAPGDLVYCLECQRSSVLMENGKLAPAQNCKTPASIHDTGVSTAVKVGGL